MRVTAGPVRAQDVGVEEMTTSADGGGGGTGLEAGTYARPFFSST